MEGGIAVEERLQRWKESIRTPDEGARAAARRQWDSIAKPLGSLGALEKLILDIAALTGTPQVDISRRAVVVCCADNGVVAEGVTQTGQEVTARMAGEMVKMNSSVCKMAQAAHADVLPVDLGMVRRVEGVLDRHVMDGTGDIARRPAMTRDQALDAVSVGVELVKELKDKGYRLLVSGEMGIGNTTTSSALVAALLNLPAETVTGRGAGLSDAGLQRKIWAIERAITVNRPDPKDILDVLSKLGGLDICGMAGLFIGGAMEGVPVVIDGFISAVAALIAQRLCPGADAAMLPSHCSEEPAAKRVLTILNKNPIIFANMRLGEGTGGVCLLPLLDMALAVYGGNATFDAVGIDAYRPQGGKGC
ncbi:MAG: nicotinate-nucleotide--dimethylbenzimidazole phosphoribosyltransferase [Clostridia bacterium]|nr:nicotinate-nucleotide--dimethylbenzimidazole phosphoribosyltransferase [Clostridia bacterium]